MFWFGFPFGTNFLAGIYLLKVSNANTEKMYVKSVLN